MKHINPLYIIGFFVGTIYESLRKENRSSSNNLSDQPNYRSAA